MTQFLYFVYDPENGSEFFPTEEKALAHAEKTLDAYRQEAPYLGWDEFAEDIVVGKITHHVEKCNVHTRKGKLDEEGCDENGVFFGDPDFDEVHDYRFARIRG